MPNLENTSQVASRRAGESFLYTYELDTDGIAPALCEQLRAEET